MSLNVRHPRGPQSWPVHWASHALKRSFIASMWSLPPQPVTLQDAHGIVRVRWHMGVHVDTGLNVRSEQR